LKRQKDSPPKPGSANIDGALAVLNTGDLRNLIREIIPRLDDKILNWFANVKNHVCEAGLIDHCRRAFKSGFQAGPDARCLK
jgi:hypothetical protein